MTAESDGGRAIAKLFGALLMAAGGLIAGLCGLCSAVFLFSLAASDPSGVGGMAMVALFVGGIPTAVGVGLFLAGRKVWRGPPPPS